MPVTNYFSVDGQVLGEETNGTYTGYVPDALGSVAATVSSAGAVQNTYRYKPFGGMLSQTGAAADPKFLWCGEWGYRVSTATEANLYARTRHYSTSTSAWTTQDRKWEEDFRPPYAYSASPIQSVDATPELVRIRHSLARYGRWLTQAELDIPFAGENPFAPFFSTPSINADQLLQSSFEVSLSRCAAGTTSGFSASLAGTSSSECDQYVREGATRGDAVKCSGLMSQGCDSKIYDWEGRHAFVCCCKVPPEAPHSAYCCIRLWDAYFRRGDKKRTPACWVYQYRARFDTPCTKPGAVGTGSQE